MFILAPPVLGNVMIFSSFCITMLKLLVVSINFFGA